MKNIIITGSTGYLGSRITKLLYEKQQYNLFCAIRHSSNIKSLKRKFPLIVFFDIEDKEAINNIFKEKKIYTLLHLAVNYGRDSRMFPTIYDNIFTIIKFTESLLEVSSIEYFINANTSINKFNSYYSLSKVHFLEWLKMFNDLFKVVNCKIGYFYGPNNKETNFITMLINKFKVPEEFINLTKCDQLRDFIYIDDVARALNIIIEKTDYFEKQQTDVYIGSNNNVKLKEVILRVKEIMQNTETQLKFGVLLTRHDESYIENMENDRVMEDLSWSKYYSLEDGIKEILMIEGFVKTQYKY